MNFKGPALILISILLISSVAFAAAPTGWTTLIASFQENYGNEYCNHDGICDLSEDEYGCPEDCAPVGYCGDGTCTDTERYANDPCPADCCGDGYCSPYEDQYCPTDCEISTYCGDGTCDADESSNTCSIDCGATAYCGDGECNNGETQETCGLDCGFPTYCGDGTCDNDETLASCSEDCETAPFCGDNICDNTETERSCSTDCGDMAICAITTDQDGCELYSCPSGYTETISCPDTETVSETVTCNFDKGQGYEKCESALGSCQARYHPGYCTADIGEDGLPSYCGPGSSECSVTITGEKGETVHWETPCGEATSYLDGVNETIRLYCPEIEPDPFCGDGICDSTETYYSCPSDCEQETTSWCGDGTCNKGESSLTCPHDCQEEVECKEYKDERGCEVFTCSDGTYESYCPEVECKEYVDNRGCEVLSCSDGTQEINCSDDTDLYCEEEYYKGCLIKACEDGSMTITCDDETHACQYYVDDSSCEIVDCGAGKIINSCDEGRSIIGGNTCPTDIEIQRKVNSCYAKPGYVAYEKYSGNCIDITCEYEEEQKPPVDYCYEPDYAEISKLKDDCYFTGGEVYLEYDDAGCEFYTCESSTDYCETAQDVPSEEYDICNWEGGELVVQTDEYGCLTYVECIGKDNKDTVIVVDDVPDATELLEIAFKLEALKIEFDGIVEKVNNLADYYNGRGEVEEAEKFQRVSQMFETAKDEVDSVKEYIRDDVYSFDEDKTKEVKRRIRYIKDVMLLDILFVMLGGEEAGEEVCTTEECFERALRSCKKATYTMDEDGLNMSAKIIGLEDGACLFELSINVEKGVEEGIDAGEYGMTCKLPDFAKNDIDAFEPEDICEGELIDLMMEDGAI